MSSNTTNKTLIGVLIAIGALLVITVIMAVSSYNGLVTARTDAESAFAKVDTQLQRRSDLIPNLMETVKGATKNEQAIVQQVTDARAKLAGAGSVNEKIDANNELSGALSRLLMVVENYPDIKSNQNFLSLQDELAGTENRITVARNDYNDAVKSYDRKLRSFPSNIFAGMFGFERMNYFEAQPSADTPPQVSFD